MNFISSHSKPKETLVDWNSFLKEKPFTISTSNEGQWTNTTYQTSNSELIAVTLKILSQIEVPKSWIIGERSNTTGHPKIIKDQPLNTEQKNITSFFVKVTSNSDGMTSICVIKINSQNSEYRAWRVI